MKVRPISSCCAVDELPYISHCKNASIVVKELCFKSRESRYDYFTSRTIYSGKMKPAAHYIYTGVVALTKGKKEFKYTKNLTDFITKNNLGTVIQSEPKQNLRFHPTHKVVVCVWTPDVVELEKWWEKNGKGYKGSMYDY